MDPWCIWNIIRIRIILFSIPTKLDSIGKGVDDIRIDLKANEKQMSRMNEQLIRVDESTKSADKRIDKLEGVRKHG